MWRSVAEDTEIGEIATSLAGVVTSVSQVAVQHLHAACEAGAAASIDIAAEASDIVDGASVVVAATVVDGDFG